MKSTDPATGAVHSRLAVQSTCKISTNSFAFDFGLSLPCHWLAFWLAFGLPYGLPLACLWLAFGLPLCCFWLASVLLLACSLGAGCAGGTCGATSAPGKPDLGRHISNIK